MCSSESTPLCTPHSLNRRALKHCGQYFNTQYRAFSRFMVYCLFVFCSVFLQVTIQLLTFSQFLHLYAGDRRTLIVQGAFLSSKPLYPLLLLGFKLTSAKTEEVVPAPLIALSANSPPSRRWRLQESDNKDFTQITKSLSLHPWDRKRNSNLDIFMYMQAN